MGKPLKIVSLPVDKGGCGWYRIRQPFEMIKAFTDHDTFIVENTDGGEEMFESLKVADICVVRQGGEAGIYTLKEYPEFKHLKFVLDIDDHMEIISPWSEHYKDNGTQEFYSENNKTWIWHNGENGFDLTRNRGKVLSLMTGLKEADLVTVTTPILANYAKQYNKNVAILPNSIDPDKWWKLPFRENSKLRIGWSGGMSHFEDWDAIKEPLNKLLRKYQFTLVVVGSHFGGVIDKDLQHLVEIHPWVPFEAHSYHMMCMNLDAAIIPLADLPFNHFKSAIKYHEFSAMGVPILVADVPPYSQELLASPDTAFGYKDDYSFEQGLEWLINNELKRDNMALENKKYTLETHNAQKNAHLWTDAYSAIL